MKRVPKDSEEPRLEIGARRELTGRLNRPLVGLLDEVVRVRVLAGEVAGKVMEHVGIPQGGLPQLARIPGVIASACGRSSIPDPFGTNHGVRNNSPMNSGQLIISRASREAPQCRQTAAIDERHRRQVQPDMAILLKRQPTLSLQDGHPFRHDAPLD